VSYDRALPRRGQRVRRRLCLSLVREVGAGVVAMRRGPPVHGGRGGTRRGPVGVRRRKPGGVHEVEREGANSSGDSVLS